MNPGRHGDQQFEVRQWDLIEMIEDPYMGWQRTLQIIGARIPDLE